MRPIGSELGLRWVSEFLLVFLLLLLFVLLFLIWRVFLLLNQRRPVILMSCICARIEKFTCQRNCLGFDTEQASK